MLVGAPVPIAVPRSRLGPPRLPADLVSRPRLLRRLDEWAGMLCVVAAPAGFGKTTLLAEWATNARRGGVAWLSIDEAAAAPAVFWAHVAAALGVTAAEDEATLAGAIALAERSASPALVSTATSASPAARPRPSSGASSRSGRRSSSSLRAAASPRRRSRERGHAARCSSSAPRTCVSTERRRWSSWVARRSSPTRARAGPPRSGSLSPRRRARAWEEQLLDFVTEEILRRPDARAFLLHTALLEELSPSVCDAVLETRRLGSDAGGSRAPPPARRAKRRRRSIPARAGCPAGPCRRAGEERPAPRVQAASARRRRRACGRPGRGGRRAPARVRRHRCRLPGRGGDLGARHRPRAAGAGVGLARAPSPGRQRRAPRARTWVAAAARRPAPGERAVARSALAAAPIGLRPTVVRPAFSPEPRCRGTTSARG